MVHPQNAPADRVLPEPLICRARADGTLTFVNDAYCQALGRTRDQLIGRSFWMFIPVDEHERMRRHLESLTPDNPVGTAEHYVTLDTGHEVCQRWIDFGRFDDAGQLVEIQCVGTAVTLPASTPSEAADGVNRVTMRRRVLAELRLSQARNRAMLGALPDLVLLLTDDGVCLDCHAPVDASGFGASAQLVGRSLMDTRPEIAPALLAAIARTSASGQMTSAEFVCDRTGTERSYEARFVPCTDRTVLAIVRDVSEARHAEEALRRAEQAGREMQQELTHVWRVAALGVLTGSFVHELNQPLMAIMSNADAAANRLAEGADGLTEATDAIAAIGEEVRRASLVVRRLVSTLDRKHFELAPLDVNAVVTDVSHLARRQSNVRGMRIVLDLAEGLPAALGDRPQVQQVVLSLLFNATEASADVDPSHRIVTIRTAMSGEQVAVSVSDRGVGMTGDDPDALFTPFYTTKPHGLGLGLSICRTIVSLLGGRLDARRNPDAGMTFSFTLPVAARLPVGAA